MDIIKTGKFSRLGWLYKKRLLVITLGLIAIVVLAIGLLLAVTNNSGNGPACGTALINKAVSDFKDNRLSDLSKVSAQISSTKNYQQDPNCMYILSAYYSETYNGQNASSSLSQMQKDIAEKKTVSEALLNYESVVALSQKVSYIDKVSQSDQTNSLELSPVAPKANTNKK